MKIAKNVKWIEPFVDAVAHLLPMHRLIQIRGYKVRKGVADICWGSITRDDGHKFEINLKIFEKKHKYDKHKRSRYEMVLQTLAHELAHMVHWEHTPDHFEFQSKLMLRFSNVLRKEGIKDHSDLTPRL